MKLTTWWCMSLAALVALPGSAEGSGAGTPGPTAQRLSVPAAQPALQAILEDGRARVAALAARIGALPDGAERQALLGKAVEIKRQTEIEFLRAAARIARERGDLGAAQQAEARVEIILHPPRPAPAAVERPVPTESARR